MPYDRMTEALRDGSVSMKAASKAGAPRGAFNKVSRATRVQPSKMTEFDHREHDEGKTRANASGRDHIDQHDLQKTPREYRASRAPGRAPMVPKNTRSRSQMGGGDVVGSDTPNRSHLDRYPRKIGETFPEGARYAGGPTPKTGNTRMKSPVPIKSGGPEGHNAKSPRYYGGPNGRDSDGTWPSRPGKR
jgi:hypothetical protein